MKQSRNISKYIFSVRFFFVLFVCVCFGIVIFSLIIRRMHKKTSLSNCVKKQICQNCNLILISVDSLRTDHIGVYGYRRNTTPNFDTFSKKGSLFTQHITPSYITTVTEAAVHTGLYPIENGVTHFDSVLPKQIKTLAQILKKNNYTTVTIHTSPEYMREQGVRETFDRGFDWYQESGGFRDFSTDSYTKIINELDFLRKKDKFFYWITAGGVHIPFGNNAKMWFGNTNYNDWFDPRILNHKNIARIYDDTIYEYSTSYPLTKERKQRLIDMYDNGVKQFDEFLGAFLKKLDKLHLMNNTVIVIYSQHGEDLGEHKTFFHADIYDVHIHTPLLIYAPKIKQTTVTSPVSSIDIYPTIFSLLGIPLPTYSQGKNLIPYICDQKTFPQTPVFSQRIPLWEQVAGIRNGEVTGETFVPHPLPPTSYDVATRTEKWKYILRLSKPMLDEYSWWKQNNVKKLYPIPEDELYNITNDPYEQRNVVNKYPEIQKQLKQTIMNWFDETLKEDIEGIKKAPRLQEYF